MFISEETQCDLMDELYEKSSHWPSVYEQIENLVKKELEVEKYSSISSNYRCIFLYHVINKEINLPDFKQILTSIFDITEDNKFNVGFTFDRFFNYRNTDITYKGYFQPHLYTDTIKPSIWDHIYYTFHDWNETGLIVNKKNLPYLQAIIEYAPEKNIGVMYEGKLHFFIDTYLASGKVEEVLPILQSIKQNPAFEKDGENQHRSFTGALINQLYHLSFQEKSDAREKMIKAVEEIKKVYPDFEDIIVKGLISEKNRFDKKEKIEINQDYLRVSVVLDMQKTVEDLNTIYHNLYAKVAENHDINSEDRKSYKAFSALFTELSSTISVYMDEPFNFDLAKIDITRNYVENYIYLKVLQTQIEKGNPIIIPIEYEQYLLDYADSEITERFYLIFEDEAKKFKSYIQDSFQYDKLNKILPINEEKEVKNSGLKI
jgi:hypothetical protein